MTEEARKYVGNTRGRPFAPGNPGKPKGARHRATRAMEALLDGESEALTRRAIEMALAGDSTAMRLCMDRLLPALRERPVSVDLPPLNGSQDAVAQRSLWVTLREPKTLRARWIAAGVSTSV